MKRAWGDPPVLAAWTAATSSMDAHCCWPYVRCNSAGRVTVLALTNINITGHVPDVVGGLSDLAHLDISGNNITGTFPTALYRCGSLRHLMLSWNHISGELSW